MAIATSNMADNFRRTTTRSIDKILESVDVHWEYYAHNMRDQGFVSFIVRTRVSNLVSWCQEHVNTDDFYHRTNSYVVWIRGKENIAAIYLTFSDDVKIHDGC